MKENSNATTIQDQWEQIVYFLRTQTFKKYVRTCMFMYM